MLGRLIRKSSVAALAGLLPHYLAFYLAGSPLWTEVLAEWIMARTPSHYAVPLLDTLGVWAKPFAMTGALAALGFAIFLSLPLGWFGTILAGAALGWFFGYHSWIGQLSFWVPAAIAIALLDRKGGPEAVAVSRRRSFLTSAVMSAGVAVVALESYARNRLLSQRAVEPVRLFPFKPPADHFAPGLVRKPVTPVAEFYGMSKNTVDPVIDPDSWRLKISVETTVLKQWSYRELLSLPREERYVTLRCVSNTLKSDLMGTAEWSGLRLSQLVDRKTLPAGLLEAAMIGIDGHGDSLTLDYAFGDKPLLALGMNGKTLDRIHGFPVRLVAPDYYGFKSVKWISEIRFVTKPYYGTWPKLGYTKDPVLHVASHIDRIERNGAELKVGGVSFAGTRGIERVQVRADQGEWVSAVLDKPLSPFTWTRWYASVPVREARQIEARACDGGGHWQEPLEGPLFPNGVTGPTIRRLG